MSYIKMETMPVLSSVIFSPESDAKTGWRKITVSITVLAAALLWLMVMMVMMMMMTMMMVMI